MADSEQTLVTYLDLACASQRRQRLSEADKLMVLAAATATRLGWPEVAAACRAQVLIHNPRHLVRRWTTIEAALETERFATYVKHVARQYPPERAEYMLGCLGERPVFTGSSAHETVNSLLAKLATQRTALGGQTSSPPPHAESGSDGHDSASHARHGHDAHSGRKQGAIRASGRAVARRLRGKKGHQEFLWWPYWAGVAVLAAEMLLWAARRWK